MVVQSAPWQIISLSVDVVDDADEQIIAASFGECVHEDVVYDLSSIFGVQLLE